jgi:bifunctional non-homologous end joining protein LigD
MRPMLASQGSTIPSGPDWVHEIKWDGMRVLADVHGGALRLTSRSEKDATATFPEIEGLAALSGDMLLDGEIVALEGGIPSFGALADRMHVHDRRRAAILAGTRPVTLMLFDVLRLYGVDLTSRTLADRRATLERLDLRGPHWQVPPVYEDGQVLHSATLEQGLEGVVSKRLSSKYYAGRRSAEWLKFAHRSSRSVVVGGWRPETTNPDRLGAVLVGAPGPDGLRYLGRVGSGLTGRVAEVLSRLLEPLRANGSPFVDVVPRIDAAGTIWVRPEVVVEVRSLGATLGGRLRQPAYQGTRPDLVVEDLAPAEPGTPVLGTGGLGIEGEG